MIRVSKIKTVQRKLRFTQGDSAVCSRLSKFGKTRIMIEVRPLLKGDIPQIVHYWTESPAEHLEAMGVDLQKVPPAAALQSMLERQLELPIQEKGAYCLIWELDGEAVGHCNTNPTRFGEEASMHLHIWKSDSRRRGFGAEGVRKSVQRFFRDLQLKVLYSEPYALNEAPNRTLEKVGFLLEKEYITTPGSLNFEQPVKRWMLTRARFDEVYHHLAY